MCPGTLAKALDNDVVSAKRECKKNDKCHGILDGSCDGKNFFMCEFIEPINYNNGCVYKRGKISL